MEQTQILRSFKFSVYRFLFSERKERSQENLRTHILRLQFTVLAAANFPSGIAREIRTRKPTSNARSYIYAHASLAVHLHAYVKHDEEKRKGGEKSTTEAGTPVTCQSGRETERRQLIDAATRRDAAHRDVAVSTIAAAANTVRYVAILSLSLSLSLSLTLRRAILNVTYADNAP